jgi:hypothetical protein
MKESMMTHMQNCLKGFWWIRESTAWCADISWSWDYGILGFGKASETWIGLIKELVCLFDRCYLTRTWLSHFELSFDARISRTATLYHNHISLRIQASLRVKAASSTHTRYLLYDVCTGGETTRRGLHLRVAGCTRCHTRHLRALARFLYRRNSNREHNSFINGESMASSPRGR